MSSDTPQLSDLEKKSLVKDGYDAVAPQYLQFADKYNAKSSTIADHIEKLIAVLPPGGKVLELGSGAGKHGTKTLVDRGFAVTATDVSASQIELAKEHIPTATLIVSDMIALDFPAGSFDAVVAFHSIPHLTREEQPKVVEKMAGWIKEGGWLLFNLNIEDKEFPDWMGVKMYSWSLGKEGNSEMVKKFGQGLKIVEDEVVAETVGRFTEHIHWFMATKESVTETQ